MTIGLMGAMQEEITLLVSQMIVRMQETIAERTYYVGELFDREVVVVFSRWGKVASSSTATTLITHFGVDEIIFTGVAGAVSNDLRIGDVVVANELYQYDMDTRPMFPRFMIPLTEEQFFRPETVRVENAMAAAIEFVQKIDSHIKQTHLEKFTITQPNVVTGTVASGDCFVSNVSFHDGLAPEGKTVMAVEMEGAAVAQVCTEHHIPYTVIRVISDKADHSAEISFQDFMADVASHYTAGILQALLD